jgi:RhtB (resistance to homoserine/threonine) family protein
VELIPATIDPQIVAFTIVAAVVTLLPGADMALVLRSVLAHGRRAGYVTSIGCCTGLWVHAVASALGVSAILMTSAALFNAIKVVGCLYLATLGVLSLRRAWREDTVSGPVVSTTSARGGRRAFAQGLLSNLLNPKVAVFYLTLLPQFIRAGDPVLARSLLLASIHVVIGLVWLTAYTYFLGRLSALLNRTRIRQALEGITGAVLIGLGARLAWDRR